MALSRDVVIRLLGDASSAVAAQKAAADAAEVSVAQYKRAERALADEQRAQEKAAAVRSESMKTASTGAMIMGGAMVAAFGLAVKASADFEKAMSGVGAATMANASQLDVLRTAALDAGAATMYSATDAANAETELAKAGLSVADITGGALAGALSLAAAGQLSVADAAGVAATALSQFHLNGSQATHVSDLLAAGAGKAMGSVGDLSSALKYVGPVASGMGISIEQTTGTLALFAQQGIIGEQAGTSLRGVISALASPSKLAANEMDNLGISVFDSQGKFIGLNGVAEQLHGALGGLTEAQRSQALGQIFGNEQLTAARVLYQSGAAGVDDWTKKVDDSGYAARQAAIQTDNLSGDIERLGGSLSTVLIQGGSGANDALRFMAQFATGAVNAIGALPGPLQATAVGLLGIAGGGTLMLGAVGTMIPKIAEARGALEALGDAGARTNAMLGTLGSVAGKGLGVLAVLATIATLVKRTDIQPVTADIDELQKALLKLGDTGKMSGDLVQVFGKTLNGVVADLNAQHPNTSWMDQVLYSAGIEDATNHWRSFGDVMKTLGGSFKDVNPDNMTAGFEQAKQNITDLDKALAGLVGNGHAEAAANAAMSMFNAWTKSGGEIGEFANRFPDTVAAMQNYVQSSTTVVDSTGQITTGMGEAKSASDLLKDSLDALNGANMSYAEANIKWTETLNGIKIAADNGTNSLDLNTAAGAANAGQFVDAAKQASAFAQAIADTQGIDAGTAAVANLRDNLIDQAVKAGYSRDEVSALIDQILKVPANTPTAITLADNATPGIGAVKNALNEIDGKRATTYIDTITTQTINQIIHATPIQDVGSGGNPIGLPPVPQRAGGGPVWPGTFLVGEEGPELVHFGGNGYVTPAAQTRAVMSSMRSSSSGIALGGGTASGGAGSAAAPAPQVTVQFIVDGEEFRGMARTEINGRLTDLYRQKVRT